MNKKHNHDNVPIPIWKSLLRWFIIALVSIIFIIFLDLMSLMRTDAILRPKFEKLSTSILWLSSDQESINSICNNIKNKNYPSDFEQKWLRDNENDIRKELQNLNLIRSSMGHLVSDKTNISMDELVCWMKRITLSETKACIVPLKDSKSMDRWRDKIMEQITADLVYNEKLNIRIRNFFLYYFSDSPLTNYPEPKCNLTGASNY